MERRLRNRIVKRPLPGDRQGTSGATAGGDSEQSGDCVLNTERAMVRELREVVSQKVTAPTDVSQITATQAAPAESVSSDVRPTTKAGAPRRRLEWTTDMNMFIMRQYYKITNLETNRSAYRGELHAAFCRQYPNMNVTEQRVADQRRTVITNKLLSEPTLAAIRAEVAQLLNKDREAPGEDIESNHVFETVKEFPIIVSNESPEAALEGDDFKRR